MGNKKKDLKPLKKSQPNRMLPNGEVSNGGNFGTQSGISTLLIKLVNLDLSILSQASLNDITTIKWEGNSYYCFLNYARLGKVPSNYNKDLVAPNSHEGIIIKLAEQPPIVIIEVNIN